MAILSRSLLWLLPGLASGSTAQQMKSSMHDRFQDIVDDPCRLFLGPSTLSGDDGTKFGLYAGVDFKVNQTLPFHELAIPLVDFLEGPYSFIDDYSDILKLIEPNLWTADFAGPAKFEGNHSTTLFVGGIGSLTNYHSAYSNVEWVQASTMLNLDLQQPGGKSHPTRGVTTMYENLTMRAMETIPAGMELFASFGEASDADENEQKGDVYEQKLLRSDYTKADQLVDSLIELLEHPDLSSDAELKEDTLDLVLEKILPAAGGKRAKAIRSLIPAASRKLKQVHDVGSFKYRHHDTIKSLKWLRKNAVCVDTMKPGRSRIKDAGRGAFATRSFKKGDRVTITPVLPLYDDVLQMFDIEQRQQGETTWLEFVGDHRGTQLLMNYAFGHSNSNLFLVPTSPYVTLINHDSRHPNVQMDWADHDALFLNNELHGKTVQELRSMNPQPNFLMQFTATRDIAKGDEIVMDYGPEWENAWNEYISANDWSLDWPLQAKDLQNKYKTEPFPVSIQKGASPYPDTVFTACFLQFDDVEDGTPKKTAQGNKIYRWTGPSTYEAYKGQELYVCDLIGRSGNDDDVSNLVYTINTRMNNGEGEDEVVQVVGVPHCAILIIDRAYQSDMHNFGVFRRPIMIRDEIMPLAWRNVRDLITGSVADESTE